MYSIFAWRNIAFTLLSVNLERSDKNGLHVAGPARYSFLVVAKSATGRRNPCNLTAIPDALCVFFCIVALTHLKFLVWCSQVCMGVILACVHHIHRVMVVQAGQLSGWPVSVRAGIPTPVWATTNLGRRNPGGSCFSYLTEVAAMATTPTNTHFKFTYLFLGVRRADLKAIPCRLQVTADSEQAAHRALVREYVLAFAGRLPSRPATEWR
ncbi:Ash-like/host cell division inhibitor Icd-like protein [Serratia marcescens]|uniref:Ash-like/host cell division inhibitor Icd-like protein n=2 Tax=Serratia TaxID=613 RepID=A0ABX5N7G7_SERMA|nr:host cell division inhibitor Icd-like protein [Serratia marcescens]MDR8533605.1 host cell division inhibitor Icd-like protein [Serratia nevei]PXZ95277.1 Ash-like/host cell division inhibitor Icd-like protein [Serratia marcescens]PYA15453.1 Ash-like/host cell division inhibitor Icd-like protein [Serratia marcescens]PYA24250.1 Ash-like/host cell division inhibitor Icd-like protein [Serratia marcescens]